MNALQIQFLVCEYPTWPVEIDPNDLYYRCRFYLRIFTYHPLQVLLFDHGWGHSLASFWPNYWCLIGLFYLLKLMALTYPSVADSIFGIRLFDLLQLPILSNGLWCSSALCRSNFWYVGISFYPFESIRMTCITIAYSIFGFLPLWLPMLLKGLCNPPLSCKLFVMTCQTSSDLHYNIYTVFLQKLCKNFGVQGSDLWITRTEPARPVLQGPVQGSAVCLNWTISLVQGSGNVLWIILLEG